MSSGLQRKYLLQLIKSWFGNLVVDRRLDKFRFRMAQSLSAALAQLFTLLALFGTLASAGYSDPNFTGNRTTVVHLFEWKWNDIADECERFLGPRGYAGVQVSPPNENAVINEPFRPWWERYQPVSYRLQTRSGTEAEFASMVQRCNSAGVRIYVDAVINHMTHFTTVGQGTGGSSFDAANKVYPAVPYVTEDFHGSSECPTGSGSIEDHLDPIQSRYCELGGLRDLNQRRSSVREKLIEYLNKLVGYGVAGFRIDAAKQMWPEDLKFIFDSVTDLPTSHGFPAGTRPFIWQELIILNSEIEPIKGDHYFQTGRVTEFKYGLQLGETLKGLRPLRQLANLGEGMYDSDFSFTFVDNHDNQRGHGAGGENIITHLEPRLYKIANAFMLAWPYAVTEVMSSYFWDGDDANSWVGPPNTNGETDSVIINPDLTCGGGWICEHRWRQIMHMVEFRNLVQGTPVQEWWDNGNNQIAFCRGNKGFIVINNESTSLIDTLQTCLPQGQYCDIVTGDIVNGLCTGRIVNVGANGEAFFFLQGGDEEAVIAIHTESRL